MTRPIAHVLVLLSASGCLWITDAEEDLTGARCQSRTDVELCTAARVECGAIAADDGCGGSREIGSCGTCPNGVACVRNKCAALQPAETDEQFCARLGYDCGVAQSVDSTGAVRTASCGECVVPLTCDPMQHVCVSADPPETDQAFCARLLARCGTVTAMDNLQRERTVDCGSCADGLICDPTARTCVTNCVAETNEAFCVRLGALCGTVTAHDNMGAERTVNCGSCELGYICDPAKRTCVTNCVAESDLSFCARLGALCGTITAHDNMGVERTVNCGDCGPGGVCDPVRHECANEPPETNQAFCMRLGFECGTVTAPDTLGVVRTVDCGACLGGTTCNLATNSCE